MTKVARTKRQVKSPYPDDIRAKPAVNSPNKAGTTRATPRGLLWRSPVLCGLSSTAQRAGLSVRETKHEITVDAAIVIANCLKKSPEMPEIKAVGTNTAQSVSAIAISAVDTSDIV